MNTHAENLSQRALSQKLAYVFSHDHFINYLPTLFADTRATRVTGANESCRILLIIEPILNLSFDIVAGIIKEYSRIAGR